MTDRSTVVGTDGVPISYTVRSGRDPVLLVHGFGSDAQDTWEKTGWFDALSRSGRGVIAPDLRGHGASGKPHDAAAYRLRAFTGDLASVLAAEGLTAVDVIGYSMGAQVVRALLRDRPSLVRRTVLGGIGPKEQFRTLGVAAVRAALAGDAAGLAPEVVEVMRAAALAPGADTAALGACAEGVAGDVLLIGHLPCPALLVCGSRDPMTVGAEAFAGRLGARFVSVPRRTHVTTVWSLPFLRAGVEFLDEG